jgi:hypothetical protein
MAESGVVHRPQENDATPKMIVLSTAGYAPSTSMLERCRRAKNSSPEIAASNSSIGFASGGGFSNYFPRLEYQLSVVPACISGVGPEHSGLYNSSGCAYPDIAAQGQQIATTWNGRGNPIDDAGISTSITAGVLTLVNTP